MNVRLVLCSSVLVLVACGASVGDDDGGTAGGGSATAG
ncbi:MAG: phosphate ABC transporter substrate-binding protein, partial [Myxococcus sp.]|nr:phosphate ABC transporter substrate-binding protein [Myxococcus sp.]